MPIYEYLCKSCNKEFSLKQHIAEYDTGKVVCNYCGSNNVVRKFSTFYAKTSRKS